MGDSVFVVVYMFVGKIVVVEYVIVFVVKYMIKCVYINFFFCYYN